LGAAFIANGDPGQRQILAAPDQSLSPQKPRGSG